MLLKRDQIKKIKAEQNNSKNKKQEEATKKLLDATNAEIEVIKEFGKGRMTPQEFERKLLPIEEKRIESAIEFSGIKVEKPKEK